MATLFSRTIRTLSSILPLVESTFDIAKKAREFWFGEPVAQCGHDDHEWEDVASEDIGAEFGIMVGGERGRAGDRLVLRRRRST